MTERITCQECGDTCELEGQAFSSAWVQYGSNSRPNNLGRYVSDCCGAGYDYTIEVEDLNEHQ
jgi:hypothetical protein